ncbi:MAG: hypothetical protein LBT68_03865 [Spirochaetales bacterium]|nr:hypothetical protein [Spirochaetales bacterium]
MRLPWADAGRSLAAEEYLLDNEAPSGGDIPVLLAYENSEALVIGKNQNPWKEIALAVLHSGSPRFFRRISGGGTVWHGPGNLNFSFIVPRGGFSKEENLDFVRRAVGRLGIPLERTARGDLEAGGKKVSGNALCYRKNRVLHHGTLLVRAALDRLKNAIAPSGAAGLRLGIETRAVASVPASVANLADFADGIDCASLTRALLEEARAVYESVTAPDDAAPFLPPAKLDALMRRHDAWEWLYGMTPAFICRVEGKTFTVKDGIVVAVDPPDDEQVGKRFWLD